MNEIKNEIIKKRQESKENYTAPEALIVPIAADDVLLNSLEIIPWGRSRRNSW